MKLFWFAFQVIVSFTCMVYGSCLKGMSRVYSRDLVLENFKFLSQKHFVGQDDAYDATLSALRKFKPKDLLLLHFVGTSGTGKTLLATIVQRSFFTLRQWHHEESSLLIGTDQCGVVFADFLNALDSPQMLLEQTLNHTFSCLPVSFSDPVLFLLDNFNLCKDECNRLMSKMIATKKYLSYSLVNVVFLLTSDLSQEGLRLVQGESRERALSRVLASVSETWGEDSSWNDLAHVVPFSPYSDTELLRIFDLAVVEIQHEIRVNIEERLNQESRVSIWSGRFKFSETDKSFLMDRLHREISLQNCRAFEKIKHKMIAATRRPIAIEERLLKFTPISRPWTLSSILINLWNLETADLLQTWEYTQDIVFKTVEDSRFVVLEVDDIDQVYRVGRSDL